MKCPYCSDEMEKGTGTFMTLQGFSHIMLVFTPEAEADKSIFKQKTKEKIITSAEEDEVYFCVKCNKLIPILPL